MGIPKVTTFGAVWCAQHQRRGLGTTRVPNSNGCAADDIKGVSREKFLGRTVASRAPVAVNLRPASSR